MYGRGLRSIRWRFAIASAVLTLIGCGLRDGLAGSAEGGWALASLVALAIVLAGITFLMAAKLTGQIARLQRSTEAIAAGDLDAPVDVDCECEVGGLAQSFRKMTARMNANLLRINTLAYTDPITSLPNRSVIDHMLGYALAPERATRFAAAIVFIDLDGFKRVNDTLGHHGGDELLRLAAERILARGFDRTPTTIDTCVDAAGTPCERLPEDVVFARFAGDEFVAILPGVTDRRQLAAIGEAIVEALRAPFTVRGTDVTIGASVGIAITPEDTTSAAELLTFADLAMYSSKQAGKSRCMFFDKRIRETIVERARIEADLRLALERDELVLHFQPKLDARTLELRGVEALVRWNHPTRGLVYPGAFIDVAESSGLMARLGARVMRLAVMQCRAWLDAGITRPVAVNVSPSQFTDRDFVDDVLAILAEYRVPPALLSVEVTESMAMTDFEATAARLARLRAAGIQVSIDDFGIGFSNLSQLARLPLDALKIDRSLVIESSASEKAVTIVRAIVGMARALGYQTIAEGIETPEQLERLRELGCDVAQGYLFGKPMPAERLDAWQAERAAVLREEASRLVA
jgi:two-component system CheB/CheR fusion protein